MDEIRCGVVILGRNCRERRGRLRRFGHEDETLLDGGQRRARKRHGGRVTAAQLVVNALGVKPFGCQN